MKPTSKTDTYEPILHDEQRLALYPVVDNHFWRWYQSHIETFWTAREIDLTMDANDWNKLTDDERYYIEMVLGFFAASDMIVNEHLETDFIERITLPELQMYYRFQAMMEDIHTTMYADLIQTLVTDTKRRDELFHAVQTVPVVQKKAEWARSHIYKTDGNDVENFVRRLIVFACVEGIFFSGSFCAIFWLKKRGLMPGLIKSNEFISRDEGIHRDVACDVYRLRIKNKLDKDEVIKIVTDAVQIEQEFVQASLPVELIGMNSALMCEYIEFVADHLLMNLIGRRHYNGSNPFPWMSLISMNTKDNFFEVRNSNYIKGKTGKISFDEDF